MERRLGKASRLWLLVQIATAANFNMRRQPTSEVIEEGESLPPDIVSQGAAMENKGEEMLERLLVENAEARLAEMREEVKTLAADAQRSEKTVAGMLSFVQGVNKEGDVTEKDAKVKLQTLQELVNNVKNKREDLLKQAEQAGYDAVFKTLAQKGKGLQSFDEKVIDDPSVGEGWNRHQGKLKRYIAYQKLIQKRIAAFRAEIRTQGAVANTLQSEGVELGMQAEKAFGDKLAINGKTLQAKAAASLAEADATNERVAGLKTQLRQLEESLIQASVHASVLEANYGVKVNPNGLPAAPIGGIQGDREVGLDNWLPAEWSE